MKKWTLFLLAAIMLVLSACSSGEEDTATETESGGDPVTIQGTNGEVTLDEPAKKVVVLEWTYAEDLLAVGVQPAGMADITSYGDYVNIEPQLDDTVVDVGGRQEPNLEAIAEIDPD